MSSKPGLHPLEVLESESQETKEEQTTNKFSLQLLKMIMLMTELTDLQTDPSGKYFPLWVRTSVELQAKCQTII